MKDIQTFVSIATASIIVLMFFLNMLWNNKKNKDDNERREGICAKKTVQCDIDNNIRDKRLDALERYVAERSYLDGNFVKTQIKEAIGHLQDVICPMLQSLKKDMSDISKHNKDSDRAREYYAEVFSVLMDNHSRPDLKIKLESLRKD